MINIEIENNIVKYNGFEGYFDSTEYVDDKFFHIIIGGIPLGVTIKDTTLNNQSYASTELFIDAINQLTTT